MSRSDRDLDRPAGKGRASASKAAAGDARRRYRPPRLVRHGNMARVTRKSGAISDINQITKPGLGGG